MATATLSIAYQRDAGEAQLRTEAEVRRLLRRASSLELATFPLAQALCNATGIPNARAALRRVIENALQGPREARLRAILLSELEDRVPRSRTAQHLEISRRHLQRRRAAAVTAVAAHVRRLIGAPHLAAIDDVHDCAADPLETIAELMLNVEPAMAARLLNLGGAHSVAKARQLSIRACVDLGNEIPAELIRDSDSSLDSVLKAQALLLTGKPSEAKRELHCILISEERDPTYSAEIRFELEWLAYLRAGQSGDAKETARVAANLKRVAADHASRRSRALLASADAEIRLGRLQNATILLSEAELQNIRGVRVADLAIGCTLGAEIALARGDDVSAERLAGGAAAVLRGRHCDANRALATVARARLRQGKPWTHPDGADSLSATAWHRVALAIEGARHLNARGLTQRARKSAREAFNTSVTLKYGGLAARAAATCGLTFKYGSLQRNDWFSRALSHLLATRDRAIACDLFGCPETPIESERLADVLCKGLQAAIPQLQLQSDTEIRAARTFLKHFGAHALGLAPFSPRLSECIAEINVTAGSFAQYLLRFSEEVADVLETAFTALTRQNQRSAAGVRCAAALRELARTVHPRDDIGRFLVG